MSEMKKKGILKEVDGAKVVWFDEWETPLIVQKKYLFNFFYFYFYLHFNFNHFFFFFFRDGGYLYSTTDLAAG